MYSHLLLFTTYSQSIYLSTDHWLLVKRSFRSCLRGENINLLLEGSPFLLIRRNASRLQPSHTSFSRAVKTYASNWTDKKYLSSTLHNAQLNHSLNLSKCRKNQVFAFSLLMINFPFSAKANIVDSTLHLFLRRTNDRKVDKECSGMKYLDYFASMVPVGIMWKNRQIFMTWNVPSHPCYHVFECYQGQEILRQSNPGSRVDLGLFWS